jgi:quinoprotein glucose dehydrogenase
VHPTRITKSLLLLCSGGLLLLSVASAQSHTTWQVDKGSPDGSNYSALKQIDCSNVGQLKVAWTFPTGDNIAYTFNPLIVDNVMYVLAKNNSITALDANSGKELWTVPAPVKSGASRRGLNYW